MRRAELAFMAAPDDELENACARYDRQRAGATVRNRLIQSAIQAQKVYQDQHIGDVPNKITLVFEATSSPQREVTDEELEELGLTRPK